MNRNLLRGKLAEKGMSQKELAKVIGISTNSLSRKMLGRREFTLSEAIRICDALNIKDPAQIFFNQNVPDTQRKK